VVGKLILLLVLGFVTALYFPDSRQVIVDKAMPVLQPMLIWNAEREMENFTADAATDPWGTTYSYQAWADSFAIRSDGPDGDRGSVDDLRVAWQRPW
jgi:hypothetical protein